MLTLIHPRSILLTALCSLPFMVSAEDGASQPIYSLFSDGKTSFDFRYRYENVGDDSTSKDAQASSLRSRLTFQSGTYQGFSFLTEFDDVTTLGDDHYNSTANGRTQYAVVADPEGTEVNQAYLSYTSGNAVASYGRQRILHANQRFIGGVGWRQNEQTYDGFLAQFKTDTGLAFDYAYVYNVNRIFGPDDGPVQPADHSGDNHFLRVDYKISEMHSLSAFGYALDIDQDSDYAPGKTIDNSSDTYGLEYSGKFGAATLKASYATQSDAGKSNLKYDADYFLMEAGYKFKHVNLSVGYEELGAKDGVGFKTPYATLHKFQGWADKFLVTPPDGIEDIYLGIVGAIGAVKLGAFYHDFSAESSSADFGSEIDFVATWPANENLSFQLKAASFTSDDNSRYRDTDKLWVTVQFKI